jgi:hypothetical protein
MWMHSTLEACCEANYSWQLTTCLGSTEGTGSTIWYMDFSLNKCVMDFVGASRDSLKAGMLSTLLKLNVAKGECGGIQRHVRLDALVILIKK